MANDVEIIKTLEKSLGIKLNEIKTLDAFDRAYFNNQILRGYLHDENENVTGLGLYDLKLIQIPPEVFDLKSLERLYLPSNQLSSIPDDIEILKNLKSLDLRINQLQSIPESIGNLKNLESLYLFNNQLTNIPGEIVKLNNLNHLSLGKNQFKVIPPIIEKLTKLIVLWFDHNQLTQVQPEIVKLINLKEIFLNNNKLEEIPPEIGDLENLQFLHLDWNNLKVIPPELGKLSHLHTLHLNNNKISKLPKELGNLKNLKRFFIDHNQIIEIPRELKQLQNLDESNIEANDPLVPMPPNYVFQARNSIKAYFIWINDIEPPSPPDIQFDPDVEKILASFKENELISSKELAIKILGKRNSKATDEILKLTEQEWLKNKIPQWKANIKLLYDRDDPMFFGHRVCVLGICMTDQKFGHAIVKSQIINILLEEIKTYHVELKQILQDDFVKDYKAVLTEVGKEKWEKIPETPSQSLKDEKVNLQSDKPAVKDLLKRKKFADALGRSLNIIYQENKNNEDAFVVNLYGCWGAGKTSFLNFLKKYLTKGIIKEYDGDPWIVIEYDAWKYQHNEPSWWSLIDSIISQSKKFNLRCKNIWNFFCENLWRLTVGKEKCYFIIVVILLVWLLITPIKGIDLPIIRDFFIFAENNDSCIIIDPFRYFFKNFWILIESWIANIASIPFLINLMLLLYTLNKSIFVGSNKSIKNFIENTRDSEDIFKRHFKKIVERINKPIIIFIDNLDRCKEEYVVSLLEGIQTLFKKVPVTYVISADRRWIRASFEIVYKKFKNSIKKPCQSMGDLFMSKTFQMVVPIPHIPDGALDIYYDNDLLERPLYDEEHLKVETDKLVESEETQEKKFLSNEKDEAKKIEEKKLEGKKDFEIADHVLAQFKNLIERNPRDMKRYINFFVVQRSIAREILNREELIGEEQNELALWTIIVMYWPDLAEHLEQNSGNIIHIKENAITDEDELKKIPEEVRDYCKLQKVCDVVHGLGLKEKVVLDESAIRKIAGL